MRPYNSHKLQPCSIPCVFLGYSLLHKGYKCLHLSSNRVYISRNVILDETHFPFAVSLVASQLNSMSSGTYSSQVQPASSWTALPIRVGPHLSQPMPFQASAHFSLTPPDTLGPTDQAQLASCPIITSDQAHAPSQIHASS